MSLGFEPLGSGVRLTLQERTYQAIKDALLNGELTAGQSVTIREIAQTVGTSPTPVREAIRRLLSEGGFELLPNGTIRVRHMTEEITRLTDLSVRCCERVREAVGLLGKLSDQNTATAALKTCEEIDKLESDADRVMRSAMSKLFREEPDVREVIKLKAIYELLETITDKCEDVANVVEGIVLENS